VPPAGNQLMPQKIPRMVALAVIVVLFIAVIALDMYGLLGHLLVASLYAIPVLVAAQSLSPRQVGVVSSAAFLLYVFSIWWKAVPITVWPYGLISLVIISYLSILLSTRLAEVNRRATELEEARSRLQEFVSIVAHELRGPLTTLLGYSQLLARRHENSNPEMDTKAISSIESEAHRMDRLTTDLLDAARIGAGRLNIEREKTDVAVLARQVAEEHQANTTKHTITVDGPASLGGCWDSDRIMQVLTNLVTNAIKYSPDGGEITILLTEGRADATVTVTDTGIGLSAEDLPLLFEPFSRLYRQQAVKGTGLGLYISKGIIEAHGGEIWAESSGRGKGASFVFTLPLERK
jgi:signal transduction histidine kinase